MSASVERVIGRMVFALCIIGCWKWGGHDAALLVVLIDIACEVRDARKAADLLTKRDRPVVFVAYRGTDVVSVHPAPGDASRVEIREVTS
jgi:hypothetical protein